MTRRHATVALGALLGLLWSGTAQAQTMGLLRNDPGAFDGYTLFSTLTWPVLYLVDMEGRLVHSWETEFVTGNTAYILENGHVMRCADPMNNTTFVAGGDGGLIQELDWDGTVLWEFMYSDTMVRHHHDIEPLPNGNVLVIAWEYKSGAEAIQAGRDPATMVQGELWPEHIIEVEKTGPTTGNIVWEWHLWDHLVQDFDATKDNYFGPTGVADHPELIDINFRGNDLADWIHMNSVDYHEEFDLIVMSSPRTHEFWVIDHSTTTAEAAGHTGGARGMGGDILYRWGNPIAYDRGVEADQRLFNQHDVTWIPPGLPGAGNILVFNNQQGGQLAPWSSVDEIVTPIDVNGDYPALAPGVPHGPTDPLWKYKAPNQTDLYSGGLSGAQRLPNGNTLIASGRQGWSFEVNPAETILWEYINPVNNMGPMTQFETPNLNFWFRVTRYDKFYAGFTGRNLSPGLPIELAPPVPGLPGPWAYALVAGLLTTLVLIGTRKRRLA